MMNKLQLPVLLVSHWTGGADLLNGDSAREQYQTGKDNLQILGKLPKSTAQSARVLLAFVV